MSYSKWVDKENVFRELSAEELPRVSGGEGFDEGEGGEGGEGGGGGEGGAIAATEIVANGKPGGTPQSQDDTVSFVIELLSSGAGALAQEACNAMTKGKSPVPCAITGTTVASTTKALMNQPTPGMIKGTQYRVPM